MRRGVLACSRASVLGWLLLSLADDALSALRPCEQWAQRLPSTTPGPVYGHAMVWDSERHVAILFGGIGPDDPFGQATLFNDVWEFDPETNEWSKAQVVGPSPAPRMHPGMAYDADRKVVVMFGGQDTRDADSFDDFLSDTWEYDPAARTWTAFPDNVFAGNNRSGVALAYDAVRKKTVQFGGFERETLFSGTWEWNGATWTQAAPAHHPSPRAFEAMAWSSQLGKIVIHGGIAFESGFDTIFNDIWAWDGTDWVEILQPFATLIAASGHSMAYDPTRAHLLSVGEYSGGDVTRLLEFPYSGSWQTVRTDGPPPRTLGAMVVSDDGRAILYGGRHLDIVRGDTWVLHGFTPELGTQPLGHQTGPCLQNQLHVVARTDVNGVGPFTYHWRKYTPGGFETVIDGFRFSGATTDTLVIDPFRPEDAGTYAAAVSNECGTTESSHASITLADAYWEQTGALPSPRSYIDMAYDTARQRMVSFGGRTIFTDFTTLNFGDTIERVGTTWTKVAPSGPSPAPRSGYALAYDPVHAVTVLHGGVSLTGPPNFDRTLYGDTWGWNGTSWTLLTTSGPSARNNHKMIWDAARQRIVLFGGTGDGGDYLPDLWEWDGTTWTPRAATGDPAYGLPYGRYLHGLAYDADRGVIVLHGGYHLSSPPYSVSGDTWELTGSQWQRRAAAAFDSPLYHPEHHGMTYHAGRGKTLLAAAPVGNTSQDPSLTITFWEWQPAGAWQQLPGIPPWRISPALGYDPVRKATVLSGGDFGCLPGGVSDNCSRGDTWEWKYFEYDPTCGAVACGDGIVDPPEECDESICCSDTCMREPAGTSCSAHCDDPTCSEDGKCVCPPSVCGNGIKDFDEDCDDGDTPGFHCCTTDCTFVAAGSECGAPCSPAICVGSPPDPQLTCIGGPPLVDCTPASSALGYVPDGGTLTTPDQSVTLTLPPGGPAGTYIIRGGLATSQYGVGTADTRILVAEITPTGTAFASPGALLRFRWPDANDDGIVDGTTIAEDTLALYKNGNQYTNPCSLLVPGPCAGGLCCDRTLNEIVVRVFTLSEFVVVPASELATTTTTSTPTATTSPTPTTTSPTSTTIPACTTVRCALDDARETPACAGQTLPASVAAKLDRAIGQIELAPSQTEKKAKKLYKTAKRLLGKASKAAGKAARGRRPKLSAECASALRDAIANSIGRVGI
jgi:hypothetical protein